MRDHASGSTLRLVIADDDEIGREHLLAYIAALNRQGADIEVVSTCSNGMDAVRAVCDTRPAVLLLDGSMPDLDGVGVVRQLAANLQGDLPYIVFVTAFDAEAVGALKLNALDCLQKPLTLARFAEALTRARASLAPAHRAALQARLRAWVAAGSNESLRGPPPTGSS